MGIEHLAVPPELLTASCNPDDLGFETTDEVSPLEGTIGQERAESALELGLNIDAPGFNLFVAGPPGTGRNTALRSYVERVARRKSEPPDWGYVHNFRDPAQPVAISLSCGMMRAFAEDMNDLVDGCRLEIPRAFEGDDYTRRVDEAMKEIQARRQKLTEGIDSAARAEGFVLTSTPAGISPVPVVEDRPMSGEEFTALSDERRGQLREKSDALQPQINRFMADIRRLNKEAVERAREVDTEIVKFTLQPIIHELQDRYRPFPPVVEYLDRVEADLVAHLDVFKTKEEQPSGPPGLPAALGEEDPFVKYRVNDLVDNSMCDGAPVIFEYSPSYYNLFGRIDYRARFGAIATDLTMIKAGALHRANGGYLVVQAKDILASPMSYETLKRSLRSQEIRIENIGEQYSPLPSATLRPQPIPLNAKVIVVGSQGTLRWLQALDDDFRRYLKVTADFDTLMERSTENLGKYASFVAERCRESGLRPFHKSGVASVIDYSSRLVEHQDKLTTRFMDVADIITEANYWAGVDNSNVVSGAHVERAVSQRNYRNSLTEDRLQELIEEGTIHIDTEGAVVGQVNALAVLAVGDHVFGKPSRISARVSLGRGQLINVERETKLTGRIHDKGFMVLTGYLQGKPESTE